MADNTIINPGSGGDTIATDDVTTLNGSASSGVKVQRMKVMYGADASATDVSASTPLPSLISDGTNTVTLNQPNSDSANTTDWTVPTEGYLMMYNGTTWDRVRGTITNGVDVDVTRMTPDGTNVMPSMDAPNRAAYVELTDGTNVFTFDTAFSDAEVTSQTHMNVGAMTYGLNAAGTLDRTRVNTTTFKCATYTSAQTGTALWTPAAGKAIVVTSIQIQSYGTTAGTAQVWFGASADTTYTRGTDAPIFDGEFAPSATNKPGFAMTYPVGQRGTADYVLRVTTTNAQSITINVWGYEI